MADAAGVHHARRGRARRPTSLGSIAAIVLLVTAVGSSLAPAHAADAGHVIRFEPEGDDGQLHLVDRGRYAGALELDASAPGIVVNDLPLEEYVAGVDEMPSRWHPEALRAQAIAARTYGWYSIGLDSFDGYDVCATTSCQVYRGIGAVEDADTGGRWLEAVRDTAGQVLMHDGGPILARYFSTSGGHTVPNEVAFPASGSRPYLVGIEDPYDEASPYHRWNARFTREEFDTLLARGETLSAVVPVVDVERIGDVDDPGASIRVTGRDGGRVEVGARELSDFLSRMAPDSFPDRFPQARSDGLRPLPTAVPSSRFAPEVTDDEVVLHGRGWGHAVGMGQYAANARAQDGHSHLEILAAYYGGLEPTIPESLPDTIRVGLEVAGPHRIAGSGAFRIVVDGEVAVERAIGPWTVTYDDGAWQLTPPDGHDEPLEVSSTRLGNVLSSAAGAVTVEAEVNKPVLLRLHVVDERDETVLTRELGAVEAGAHVATWRTVDAEGEALPAGDYRVALMAEDASGRTGGVPVTVTVQQVGDGAGPVVDGQRPDGPAPATALPWLVTLAGIALVLAIGALVVTNRRRPS